MSSVLLIVVVGLFILGAVAGLILAVRLVLLTYDRIVTWRAWEPVEGDWFDRWRSRVVERDELRHKLDHGRRGRAH